MLPCSLSDALEANGIGVILLRRFLTLRTEIILRIFFWLLWKKSKRNTRISSLYRRIVTQRSLGVDTHFHDDSGSYAR